MLDIQQIYEARDRIAEVVTRTPLIHYSAVGRDLYLKAESLQRTGSFKFRGAYNTLAQFDEAQRAAGAVACSSGNHAQGMALAGKLLSIPTTIVMPADAPKAKISNTRRLGAEVRLYDRASESREAIALEIHARTGAEIVWPYDDYRVMAGQGTTGLELLDQLGSTAVDFVLVPASGGGLAAGVGTAFRSLSPNTQTITVEPLGFDDHARSFESGRREKNQRIAGSLCDALLAPTPGELTFPVNLKNGCQGIAVSEEAALQAMRWAFDELRLVLEPAGAIAISAALEDPRFADKKVALILSGGNVDPEVFRQALHP